MIKEEKLFTCEVCDGVLTVKLVGEIDHHSAVSVRADIDSLIFEKRPKKVVLDLSEISFMDSSGLGLIMGRYSLMREQGGEVVVVDPAPMVERVMDLAGMRRIIAVVKREGAEENDR